MKINHYLFNSFFSCLNGLVPFDDKDESSSTFNNLGSMTNRFFFIDLI